MATLTVYPDAGTGGTTMDALLQYLNGSGEDWATIRTQTNGTTASATVVNSFFGRIRTDGNTDKFDIILRGIFLFDTSSLGGDALLSTVTLSLYGTAKIETLTGNNDLDIGSSSPASDNNVVAGDYSQIARTSFGSIAYASYSTSAYNDITLNANGISNIDKTGISKFSTQIESDMNNTEPTWVAGNEAMGYSGYYADQSGTTQDPKLTITYIVPSTFKPKVIMF